MRTLEDGAGANGEVQFALVAAIEAALARRDPILPTACRASDAVRPKPFLKVEAGGFRIRYQGEELEGAYRALAHEQIVLNSLEGVKYYFERFGLSSQPVWSSINLPARAFTRQAGLRWQ